MERSRTPSVISVASLAPSQRSTVSPTGNLHGWQAGRHSGVAGPCKLQCLQRAPCCLQGRMKQLLEQRECAHPTRRSVLWNALSCTRASQLGHLRVGLYPAQSSSAEGSVNVKADAPAPQDAARSCCVCGATARTQVCMAAPVKGQRVAYLRPPEVACILPQCLQTRAGNPWQHGDSSSRHNQTS